MDSRHRVFWTAPRHDRPELFEMLRQAGCDVRVGRDYRDRSTQLTEDEFVAAVGDVRGIIVGGRDRVTRRVLEAAPDLVVVAKTGTGVDTIDVDAATELGVLVTNTPVPAHRDAVVEHALSLLLAVTKRVLECDRQVRSGSGLIATNTLLAGKTAGIIGYGRIGRRMAAVLEALGMTVMRHDPFVAVDDGVPTQELHELVALNDVVSLHATPTGVAPLLNRSMLDRMKPSAVLVNTARASLVDEQALAQCLREGRIGGAGIDVFSTEPPPADHPLLAPDLSDSVVLSPHAAASVSEARHQVGTFQIEVALSALAGREPETGIVNPEVLEHWRSRVADIS